MGKRRPDVPQTAIDGKQEGVAEYRRSEILVAAMKVFGDKGFEAARMEEIAKVARLAKGTVYFYYPSKDAIYQAAVQEAFAKLNALTEAHVQDGASLAAKLTVFVRVRLAYWDEQPSLYLMILAWSHDIQHRKSKIDLQRGTVAYLQGIFSEAGKNGQIPEQDYEEAAWGTMFIVRGFIERRVLAQRRSADEDTKFLTEFILNAVRART
jgi:AcrR family transcriptional regulator